MQGVDKINKPLHEYNISPPISFEIVNIDISDAKQLKEEARNKC